MLVHDQDRRFGGYRRYGDASLVAGGAGDGTNTNEPPPTTRTIIGDSLIRGAVIWVVAYVLDSLAGRR